MNKNKTKFITSCALMAAVLCILGPLSIAIGPVPVSLATFVIYLTVILLGFKGATVSVAIYLLLGMIGLPVFSGYSGGLTKLAGPTGGYLIGYIFVAIIGGIVVDKFNTRIVPVIIGLLVGTAVLYVFGTAWFIILMQCDLAYALSVCVVPFIPVDICKIIIAVLLGKQVKSALIKAGLL